MTDRLDGLRSHAHRLSLRLMTIAGLMTGLLLGIGFLFMAQSLRAAVALWALTLAVGALMVMLGLHVRRQAEDLYALGSELRGQQTEVLRRTAEATNVLGEMRARLAALDRRVSDLEADGDAARLDTDDPLVSDLPPVGTAEVASADPDATEALGADGRAARDIA